jgi:hypothetical protein
MVIIAAMLAVATVSIFDPMDSNVTNAKKAAAKSVSL